MYSGAGEVELVCLWVGKSLGPIEQLSLLSALEVGMAPTLYAYDEVQNLPAGVKVRDARRILPQSDVFSNGFDGSSFAGFSNLFRYHLMLRPEAVWFDLDIVFLQKIQTAGLLLGLQDAFRVNGAVLALPSKELAEQAIEICRRRLSQGFSWGDLGPNLLTELVHAYGLWTEIQGQSTFYPVHYRETWALFDPEQADRVQWKVERASTLHLWNEVLRQAPSALLKATHPESYLGKLLGHFGLLEPRKTVSTGPSAAAWGRRLDPPSKQLARWAGGQLPPGVARRISAAKYGRR